MILRPPIASRPDTLFPSTTRIRSDVTDIMLNGPKQTYSEKKGKLQLAPIQFRDEGHLFQIAQRIVNQVGRRVDQTTPLADARLKDGRDRKSPRLNSSH